MSNQKENVILTLYSLIQEEIIDRENYILGKILTIIDAAISDPEQRKGIKDLIKQSAYTGKNWHIKNIGRIISQFNKKYAGIDISDNDNYYLINGEWKKEENFLTSDQMYFPE